MEQFLKNFSDPAWILTSIVLSLIISVVGSYLVRLIDKSFIGGTSLLKKYSQEVKVRKQLVENSRITVIQEISEDLHEQLLVAIQTIRQDIQMVLWTLMLIFFMGLHVIVVEPWLKTITLHLGAGAMAMAIKVTISNRRWSHVLAEGYKKYKDRKDTTNL
jgi:hypothetical protein